MHLFFRLAACSFLTTSIFLLSACKKEQNVSTTAPEPPKYYIKFKADGESRIFAENARAEIIDVSQPPFTMALGTFYALLKFNVNNENNLMSLSILSNSEMQPGVTYTRVPRNIRDDVDIVYWDAAGNRMASSLITTPQTGDAVIEMITVNGMEVRGKFYGRVATTGATKVVNITEGEFFLKRYK